MFVTLVTCIFFAPFSLVIAIGVAGWKLQRQREANAAQLAKFKRAPTAGPEWNRFKGLGIAPEPMREETMDTAALNRALKRRGYRGSERAPFPAALPKKS